MESEEKVVCRPDSHSDSPCDAVQLKTMCIRSDFTEKSDGTIDFTQEEKSEAHISASVEMGILSIRDMKTGVMLTVVIDDAMVLLAAALDAAKEKESCTETTSEPAEVVEKESDL